MDDKAGKVTVNLRAEGLYPPLSSYLPPVEREELLFPLPRWATSLSYLNTTQAKLSFRSISSLGGVLRAT